MTFDEAMGMLRDLLTAIGLFTVFTALLLWAIL